MPSVLYISYDGALDPLGRSQVVPYVEGLAARGYRFHLLTFEKPSRWADREARHRMADRLAGAGVRWHPLTYHKRPPVAATAWDLVRGFRRVARIHAQEPLSLVHARSYPSALLAHRLWSRQGVPFVFDMRGFYPEERVDGGLWRAGGVLFRLTKRLEARFLRDAAGVVTLTQASVPALRSLMEGLSSRASLAVIPTSVDLARFRPIPRSSSGFTLGYFGSIGTWYLLEEMMELGRVLLDEVGDSRLLFVVNSESERVRSAASAKGIPPARIEIRSVSHEEVPSAVGQADATFFLIRPAPSKVSSAATKFGESLAMGIPVMVNRGVGDSAAVVESDAVGVVVEGFTGGAYREAVSRLVALARAPGIRERCVGSAAARYDLARAVDAYASLYAGILGREGV